MWTLQTSFFLFLCVLVWASPCCCEPLEADSGVRTTRQKTFQSVEDLRSYLDQMGLYYAVAGRPRFGKRAGFNGRPAGWSSTAGEDFNANNNNRHSIQQDPNDQQPYDQLYYFYSNQDQ